MMNQLELLEQIKKFDLLDNERRRATAQSYYHNLRNLNRRNPNEDDDDDDNEKLPCCNTCCGYNCWWEAPSNYYSLEFCRSSSLHGVKFIGETTAHFGQRILFTIFFILGILASVYLINQVVQTFIESPTIVTFTEQHIPLVHIPFPAVTICNVNNVRRSSVEKYKAILENGTRDGKSEEEIEQAYAELQFLQNVCVETSNDFTSEFSFTRSGRVTSDKLANFLEKHAPKINKGQSKRLTVHDLLDAADVDQPCEEMIPYCLWQNAVINCSQIFHTLITDFGKCCTFNMAPLQLLYKDGGDFTGHNLEEDKWGNGSDLNMDALIKELYINDINVPIFNERPRRVRESGITNGLSVLVFPDIEEYFCTASDSIGIHTALHLPIDFPHLAQYGEGIGPDTETFIKIKPEVTKAEASIRDVPIDARKCYFNEEIVIPHFNQYSHSNCYDECMAEVNMQLCGCINFHMPSDEKWPLCTHKGINCTGGVYDSIRQEGVDIIDDICQVCLPTCTGISYKADVTSRPFNYEVNEWATSTEVNLTELRKERVSLLHFYFDDSATYPKIRKRLYVLNDLIGNIGGLLGLCLGFSILSVVELLYYLIFKICGENLHQFKFKRLLRKLYKKIRAKKRVSTTNITFVKSYGHGHGHGHGGGGGGNRNKHFGSSDGPTKDPYYYEREQPKSNAWKKKKMDHR